MNNNQPQQQQNNMPMESGSSLTRYRSAPSSYFATLLSGPADDAVLGEEDFERLFDPPTSSPEAQRVFATFADGTEAVRRNSSTANMPSQSQFLPPAPRPRKVEPQQQLQGQHANDYSSYGGFMGPFSAGQVKIERVGGGAGGNSGLIRHSSSPAGLFADIDIENEFGAMRDMGNFGGGNNSASAETSSLSASRFKRQMNPIPEMDIKGRGENNASNTQYDENRGNEVDYITGLPMNNSWDDSDVGLSDNFFKGLDEQSNDGGSQPSSRLSHHLSLPTSSSELSAMEKLLQDSVPCKIRAKRGFATHPRSIAERVRRTKISERIRKLQELVPNMDKQTNTSDMLDLAVDYIKDLQRQVKTLSDNRAKCSCSGKHNS